MAYDAATKQVIMFGGAAYAPDCGSSGGDIADTWAWNGSVWRQQHPAVSPVSGGCAAFDAETGQFIMFSDSVSDSTAPGQTWEWTSTTWKQLTPASAPSTVGCAMTYDAARKVIMMLVVDPDALVIHAWTWDGVTWSDTGPLPLALPLSIGTAPPIAFDADTGEDVVYDGETYPCTGTGPSHVFTCTQTDETWVWNGSAWMLAAANNFPEVGSSYTMAYDQATHQVVLFAGHIYATGTYNAMTYVYSAPGSSSAIPVRLAGADRQSTAVAVSTSAFAATGSASVVVLARADQFADALAGGPLAAAKHGPLLLTSSGSLDTVTKTEIQRVLPAGGIVYLLGGTSALSDGVSAAVTAMGDVPVRVSGSDRYGTAVAIAGVLGNPSTVFEASGVNYPDALSAVPAAVAAHGAIVLTNGAAPTAVTTTYLNAHATTRYAIGGPAAYADPTAVGIAGADRYATSAAVALAFFPTTTGASLASAVNFPDALAGGPVAGTANHPVLLVPRDGGLIVPVAALPEPITAYLTTHSGEIATIQAFGGEDAIADTVLNAVADHLH